jgi:hypothetical protein
VVDHFLGQGICEGRVHEQLTSEDLVDLTVLSWLEDRGVVEQV